jgi:hypothetical protein
MRCKSRNLLIKPGFIFIFLSIHTCFNNITAQELKLVNEWTVNDVVDATSDFSGNLYLSNEHGVISKYDKNGALQISYSGPLKSSICSIDASHTSKIFGFYRDQQSYLILDRFLNPLNEADLDPSFAGYATETAYSADNNLWLFDQSDLSIKKVNLVSNIVITSNAIPLVIAEEEWDLLQIEEYQNRLYLYNSNKDIYLFDNLGNYIRKLEVSSDSKVCFKGNQLVFIQDTRILTQNIYNNEITEIGTLDSTNNILKIISANNFIYLIFRNKVSVYE